MLNNNQEGMKKIDIKSIVMSNENINYMKSTKVKIKDIEWNLEDSFYDDIPTEFIVDMEDFDGEPSEFVINWLDYNGSKWGATAESFDFELV